MHCLALSKSFPNRLDPWVAPYNRRQAECLAQFCRLTVINPLRWTQFLSGRVPWTLSRGPDDVLEGIELYHPVQWHLPGLATGGACRAVVRAARRVLADGQERRFDVVLGMFGYPHGAAARRAGAGNGLAVCR